jgi:MATE family multidrug resistance protein
MDTLCSQGFGSKNKKLVGLSLQRGILILSIALFPCIGVWLHIGKQICPRLGLTTEPILLEMSIDAEVARLTARYLFICIPMLPCLNLYSWLITVVFLYILLERFLQTQDIVMPTMWVNAATAAVNVGSNYLFIVVLNMVVYRHQF